MKERPILFSTPMVQAILNGNKTMTRRIVKNNKKVFDDWGCTVENAYDVNFMNGECAFLVAGDQGWTESIKCPYGKAGDILWVREKWAAIHLGYDEAGNVDDISESTIDRVKKDIALFKPHDVFVYAADPHESHVDDRGWKWKPSIHMPKAACRIRLEVVTVRVERLQDITQEDAKAEGVISIGHRPSSEGCKQHADNSLIRDCYVCSFRVLWNKINGPNGNSWDNNPWVWVIEFKRINQ